MPYLEGNNEAVGRPLVDHWLKDFRHLVHLDYEASFAGLDLVLALLFVSQARDEREESGRRTIFSVGRKKSLTAAAR